MVNLLIIMMVHAVGFQLMLPMRHLQKAVGTAAASIKSRAFYERSISLWLLKKSKYISARYAATLLRLLKKGLEPWFAVLNLWNLKKKPNLKSSINNDEPEQLAFANTPVLFLKIPLTRGN